jgi:hypothetical protein
MPVIVKPKMLPQKPETIVIDNIAEHLGSIGMLLNFFR